jgi:enoyl-CoA hydratase/carnithine racemase
VIREHYETLDVQVDGGVARVVLARPEAANALDPALLAELNRCLASLAERSEVDIVVITGSGRFFSVGGDLRMARSWAALSSTDRRQATLETLRSVESILRLVERGPDTFIARVNGLALAGGFILAAACDFIIASEQARFGLPEAAAGQVDPFSPVRLPRQVGPMKAKELLLLARQISALEAQQIGLVNTVVAHDQLDGAVDRLIAELRQTSSTARAAIKAAHFSSLADFDLDSAVEHLMSADAEEGVRAFLEKRRPRWRSDHQAR